jgi:hypothetical protein
MKLCYRAFGSCNKFGTHHNYINGAAIAVDGGQRT